MKEHRWQLRIPVALSRRLDALLARATAAAGAPVEKQALALALLEKAVAAEEALARGASQG